MHSVAKSLRIPACPWIRSRSDAIPRPTRQGRSASRSEDPSLTIELRPQASARERLPTEASPELWIAPEPPRSRASLRRPHEHAATSAILLLHPSCGSNEWNKPPRLATHGWCRTRTARRRRRICKRCGANLVSDPWNAVSPHAPAHGRPRPSAPHEHRGHHRLGDRACGTRIGQHRHALGSHRRPSGCLGSLAAPRTGQPLTSGAGRSNCESCRRIRFRQPRVRSLLKKPSSRPGFNGSHNRFVLRAMATGGNGAVACYRSLRTGFELGTLDGRRRSPWSGTRL